MKRFIYTTLVLAGLFAQSAFPVLASVGSTFTTSFTALTSDFTAPSTPVNLVATPISQSQINLSWDASIDNVAIGGYVIYRNSFAIATTTNISFIDTGLFASTTYTYEVQSFDTSFNYSNISTPVATTTLDVPVVVIATSTPTTSPVSGGSSSSSFIFGLNVVPEFTDALISFGTIAPARSTISWGLTSDMEAGSITSILYSTLHEVTVPNLAPNTHYFARITLVDARGNQFAYPVEFTTKTVVNSPLVNPSNFTAQFAVAGRDGVSLSWKNPRDDRFDSVRIVRSDSFFPRDQFDGTLVYEGSRQSFFDAAAVQGKTYYYAIFAKDTTGAYSSGALAQASSVIGMNPFVTAPQAGYIDPLVARLTLADFEFIQEGKDLAISGTSTVMINGMSNLTIRLAYNKVPEVLKTIAVSLTDPKDSSRAFIFLLRANADKTYYEASIGALNTVGMFPLAISILDYQNQSLKQIAGSVHASVFEAQVSSADTMQLLLLILIIAAIALVIYTAKRRNAMSWNNVAKTALVLTLVWGSVSVFFASPAHAAINQQINYQGKLTNASNITVADGNYNMVFKLYTVASGGAAIWTENDTSGNAVAVKNGLFSVMLGSTTPFTGVDFNQTLYLGVTVGADSEMAPRKVIGSVPAAIVAQTLQNITPGQFFRNDISNATSTATTSLSIFQYGAGKVVEFFGQAGASVLTALSNGNVGIGTTTPFKTLSVGGSFYSTYASTTQLSLTDRLYDNASSAGTAGMVLMSTASGVRWVASTTLANITGTLGVANGGTGLSSAPTYGQIMVGNNSSGYTLTATSSLGLPTFSSLAAAYPFVPTTNYAAVNQATTGIAWFQNGLNASSTSHFVYASTTALSTVGNAYVGSRLGVGTNNVPALVTIEGNGGGGAPSNTGNARFLMNVDSNYNPSIELQAGKTGFNKGFASYIDFSDTDNADYNARIILGNGSGGVGNALTISADRNVEINGTNILLNQSSGNVGIGTTLPTYKLNIKNDAQTSGTGTISDNGTGAITGSGTLFTSELRVGSVITGNDSGTASVVQSIADDTNLTVFPALDDGTFPNQPFYYVNPGFAIDSDNGFSHLTLGSIHDPYIGTYTNVLTSGDNQKFLLAGTDNAYTGFNTFGDTYHHDYNWANEFVANVGNLAGATAKFIAKDNNMSAIQVVTNNGSRAFTMSAGPFNGASLNGNDDLYIQNGYTGMTYSTPSYIDLLDAFGSGTSGKFGLKTSLLYNTGRYMDSTNASGTPGMVLMSTAYGTKWVASTTLANISGTLGVANGGTGATTYGQGWIYSTGGTTALSASTSPTVNYFTATSTTVASTFPYASTTALTVAGTNGLKVGTLNGPLQANNGTVSATSSVGVIYGGTGLTSAPTYGMMLVGNNAGGYTLTATSSLGITGVSGGTTGMLTSWTGGSTLTATGTPTAASYYATSTSSASVFPKLRNGEIAVVHIDGSVSYTYATTSSNVGRGNALKTVFATASTGDSIYLSSGTFDIGSATLDMSMGGLGSISLHGAGKYATTITGSGSIIVKPGDYTDTTDMSIIVSAAGAFRIAWGINDTSRGLFGAHIKNVFLQGYEDALYLNISDTDVSIENVSIVSSWDGIVVFGASNPSTVTIRNTDVTTAVDANIFSPRRSLNVSASIDGMTVSIYDSNFTSDQNAVSVGSNTIVNIYNGSMVGAINNTNSSSVVSVTPGTSFDPANTSGIITYSNPGVIAANLGRYGGNVGISTTSPFAKFSITGSAGGTSPLFGISTSTGAFATTTALLVDQNGNLSLLNGSKLTLNTSYNGPLQANNGVVSATTSVGVIYGGTGLTSAPTYGQVLVGNNAGGYTLTATSSLGLPTSAYPFTPLTNFGTTNQATTGIAWFQNGLNASSTSNFTYASTTALSATGNAYVGGTLAVGNQYVTATGTNALALGYSDGAGGSSLIKSTGSGSVALGYVFNGGSITSNNNGSFAVGYAGYSNSINAQGAGSFAGGNTPIQSGNITASGVGSFVWGSNISATQSLSTAFGKGFTNSAADTFQVGYSSTPTLTVNATSLGIGTTSPWKTLSVAGDMSLTGGLYDNTASVGTAGMVLMSTASGVRWVATTTASGAAYPFTPLTNFGATNQATTGIAWFQNGLNASSTSRFETALFNGNVGIGTMSPTQKLDVVGNFQISSSTASSGQIRQNGTVVFHTYTANALGNNIFIGAPAAMAGNFTTTGIGANVAIGTNAMSSITSGTRNMAVGGSSAQTITSGANNTFVGEAAGFGITQGSGNVAIGQSAGRSLTTNNNNTFIGYLAGYTGTASGISNATAIGYNAQVGASNSLILGGMGSDAVNVGVGTSSPLAKLDVYGTAGSSDIFAVSSSSNSRLFTIVANGNVGIGTTTPSATLYVNGTFVASSTTAAIIGNGSTGSVKLGDGTISKSVGGGYSFDSNINAGGGNASTFFLLATGAGTLSNNALSQNGAGSTGIYFPGSHNIGFTTAGVERIRVDSSGNVMIGTTSPSAKLSIQNAYGSLATLFDIATTTSSAYATSSLFNVLANGNVGISTTSPFKTLSVAGGFYSDYASTTQLSLTDRLYDNTASAGTAGMVLMSTASGVRWVASTTLANITGTLGVANGGTGATTYGQGWIYSTGGTTALSASTSPTVAYIYASSTSATSTFMGGLSVASSKLIIQQNTGSIGISTTSPWGQIAASSTAGGYVSFNNADGGAAVNYNTIVGPASAQSGSTLLLVQSNGTLGGSGSVFRAQTSSGTGLRISEAGAMYAPAITLFNSGGGGANITFGGTGNTNTLTSGPNTNQNVTDFVFTSGGTRTAGKLFEIQNNASPVLTVDYLGNLGVATTSPFKKLSVSGGFYSDYASTTQLSLTDRLYDNTASAGTAGMVLMSTASGVRWVASTTLANITGTLGVANGGTGLNTLGTGYIPFGNGTSAFGGSANATLDSSGNLTTASISNVSSSAAYRVYNTQRSPSATPGDTVELGNLTTSLGTGYVEFYVTGSQGGAVIADRYVVPLGYNATGGAWQTLVPQNTSTYNTKSYALEINLASGNVPAYFRIRSISSTPTLSITVKTYTDSAKTWTFTSATGSGASFTSFYAGTILSQSAGVLDLRGTNKIITGSGDTALNLSAPGMSLDTLGSLTVEGNLILSSTTGKFSGVGQQFKGISTTTPTTGNALDVFTITNANFSSIARVTLNIHTGSYAQTKEYVAPLAFGGTSGAWQTVAPLYTSGPYGGNDAVLEVNINAGTATFRVRRATGSTDPATMYLSVSVTGDYAQTTVTQLSGLAYAASDPGVTYAPTAFTQFSSGNTGIGVLTPLNKFDVAGGSVIGSGYAGVYTAPTNGLLVQGNLGIGTSSPYAKLSVDGQGIFNQDIRANYFTSTSTSIASVFPYASTTALSAAALCIGSDCRTAWPTGGGAGGGTWSTTTSQVAGRLVNYSNNSTDIVAIGANSTTTAKYWFDPNTQTSYLSGNVGIGTTSPFKALSVAGGFYSTYASTTQLTLTDRLYDNASSAGTAGMVLMSTANGVRWVATTTASSFVYPFTSLTNFGATNQATTGIAWFQNGVNASSTSNFVNANFYGNVGIGTTSPFTALSVMGNGYFAGNVTTSTFTATSTTATSTIAGSFSAGNGALTTNYDSGITTISSLQTGAINFDTDAGAVSWVDLPISSGPSAGTVESYSAQIGTTPVLTVYGQANGSGGSQNLRVGIGTTSPWKTFSVAGDMSLTGGLYDNTASAGTAGMVLMSTASGVRWVATTTSSGGTPYPFTPLTNFGSTNQATTGIAWFQNGINASSTSHFVDGIFSGAVYALGVPSSVQSTLSIGVSSSLVGSIVTGNSVNGIQFTTDVNSSPFASFGMNGVNYLANKLGIGSTSPFKALSVMGDGYFAGNVTMSNFVATSTTATSTIAGDLTIGSGSDAFVVDYTGNIGIGTSTPWKKLSVAGDMVLTGGIYDNTASAGTAGMVLMSTASGVRWVATTTASGAAYPFTPLTNFGSTNQATTGIAWFQNGLNASSTANFVDANFYGNLDVLATGVDTGINLVGNINSFFQGNIQNTNSGSSASSDWVATANNGSASTHYIDMGINGSAGGATPFTGVNHAYLYSIDDTLNIGALGSAANIQFYTTGGLTPVERMRIDNNGNVGIGSTSPFGKFAVDAGVTTNNNAINAQGSINDFLQYDIKNTSTGSGAQAGYSATANTGTPTSVFAWMGINNSSFYNPQSYNVGGALDVSFLGTGNDMYVANGTANKNLYFMTGGTATTTNIRMTIDANGKVGIGTTSPTSALAITAATNANISFATSTGAGKLYGYVGIDGTNPSLDIGTYTAHDVRIETNNIANFIVSGATSNVGIGTTTPFSELSVSSLTQQSGVLPLFTIASTTAETLMTVLGNGSVGIGTTSPTGRFTIEQGATLPYSLWIGNQGSTTPTLAIMGVNGNGNIGIGTSSPWGRLSLVGETSGAPVFLVASSTTATEAIINVRGSSQVGATSTISFFTSTTTGLTAGQGMGQPAALKNYVIVGNGKVQAGMAIVNGGLCVDSDGWCTATTTGRITARTSTLGGADVAEMYASSDDLKPGEIVSASYGTTIARASKASAQALIGIVSSDPGLILGLDPGDSEFSKGRFPVALNGRVPVKVSNENGPIAVGDPITISSTSGVGMRATGSSTKVVAIALEPMNDASGTILGFVQNYEHDDRFASLSVDTSGTLKTVGDVCAYGTQCLSASLNQINSQLSALGAQASTTDSSAIIFDKLATLQSRIDTLASSTVSIADFASTTAGLQTLSSSTLSFIASTTASDLASSTTFIQSVALAVFNIMQSSGQVISSAGDWTVHQITATIGNFQTVITGRVETQTAAVANGIEMKSPNGTTWCVRVDDQGLFTRTQGTCDTATTTPAVSTATPLIQTNPALTATSTGDTATTTTTTTTVTATTTETITSGTVSSSTPITTGSTTGAGDPVASTSTPSTSTVSTDSAATAPATDTTTTTTTSAPATDSGTVTTSDTSSTVVSAPADTSTAPVN